MKDPDRSRRRFRRWAAGVLASTAIALAIVAGINAVVDPFQQYRLATAPRFYALHHRWINPGIAKHAAYDTVLIG